MCHSFNGQNSYYTRIDQYTVYVAFFFFEKFSFIIMNIPLFILLIYSLHIKGIAHAPEHWINTDFFLLYLEKYRQNTGGRKERPMGDTDFLRPSSGTTCRKSGEKTREINFLEYMHTDELFTYEKEFPPGKLMNTKLVSFLLY